MTPQNILIVEDEHALGTALSFAVRRIGHVPELVATGTAALDVVRTRTLDAAVVDIGLPDMSGLDLIKKLRLQHSALPVLVITAHGTLDHAIAARKNGASDYLVKPLDLRQFEASVNALLSVGTAKQGADAPRTGLAARQAAAQLVGTSPALRDVFTGIARACVSDAPVLITGPTGAGKSLVAETIHANSPRRTGPLVFVSGASLPGMEELIAQARKAAAGTLVIEEVATMPPAVQSGLATEHLADQKSVRWMATSTLPPLDAMRSGGLRAELYYALSALHLGLPPLRDRTSDIPALVTHFLPERISVSASAMDILQAYDWPGNVRELEHVLSFSSDLAGDGVILPGHLPAHLSQAAASRTGPLAPAEVQATLGRWLDSKLEGPHRDELSYDMVLDQLEAMALQHLLDRHDGKPTHLANALRMNRTTLRQKLRRLGLATGDG